MFLHRLDINIMEIFNPVNFDPKNLFPSHAYYSHRIREFIGELCVWYIRCKNKFKKIHSNKFKLEYFNTKVYQDILDNLVATNVIERDNQYQKGKFSRGYRLGKKYRKNKFEFIDLNPDVNCIPFVPTTELERKVIRNIGLLNVELEQAVKDRLCLRGQYGLMMLRKKMLYSSRDFFGHRLHNNVTSLKSEARKYLNLNGVKLVNLDIANSQPFLLGLTVLEELKRKNNNNIQSPLVCYEYTLHQYLTLTAEGKLYHYLSNIFNIPVHKVKRKLFSKWLFSKQLSGIGRDMDLLFPTVTKTIVDLKEFDYKNPSMLLQRKESNIMIEGVCTTIMNQYPNIWFAPIHDSILTTPKAVPIVKNIIMNEFIKCNVKPTIREEDYALH